MSQKPELLKPTYDLDIPVPRKGKPVFKDSKRAYAVGQEQFALSFVLAEMPVGGSCLLSNWATTSIQYAQNKLGYRYTRQLQADGTVRVWRVQ